MKTRLLVVTLVLAMIFSVGVVQAADFGGKTVNFICWYNPLGHFQEGGLYEGRLEEAEKKFNVQIEFLPTTWADAEQFYMTRLISGDSANDVWIAGNKHFWPLVAQNALYAMDDLHSAGHYESLPVERQKAVDAFSYKGSQYGFGAFGNNLYSFMMVGVNKDLLEREGITDIYEIVENGEWTWDKFTEVAKAVTKDTDGDGETDQWGYHRMIEIQWPFTNGADYVKFKDGKPVFSLGEPEGIAALNQMLEWNMSGIIGGGEEGWAAGKVAMLVGEVWRVDAVRENLEFDYGFIPLPKGPAADDYVYPVSSLEMLTLPANAEDPEGITELVEFLFRPEEWEEGIQQSIMTLAQDRETAGFLMQALLDWGGENPAFDGILGPTWDWGWPMGRAIGAAVTGEKPASVAMDEVAQEVQAKLDEVFGE